MATIQEVRRSYTDILAELADLEAKHPEFRERFRQMTGMEPVKARSS